MSMYIRGFIPWIIFACFPSSQLFKAALVALIVGAFLILQYLRRGTAPDALVLEGSTVGFFAVLSLAAHFSTGHGHSHWSSVCAFGWLAATAWITLAARHPFTLGIARKSTPEEYWNTPQFLHVNVVITLVWAIAFTLKAVAIAACFGAGLGEAGDISCQALGFAIPAVFTARYPRIVRARSLASIRA
jgi:hypothetical protein